MYLFRNFEFFAVFKNLKILCIYSAILNCLPYVKISKFDVFIPQFWIVCGI